MELFEADLKTTLPPLNSIYGGTIGVGSPT